MKLVERQIYKKSNKDYKEMDNLCFLSKNLYNSTLYSIRQHYFNTSEYLNYFNVNKKFTHENQSDYRALPAKVSKQTQRLVDDNMKSFFALIKNKSGKVNIPRYLDKEKGRQIVHYEKGALSFVKKEGYIHLSKTNIFIPTKRTKSEVDFVRLVPKGSHIVVEIGYTVKEKEHVSNGKFASLDLGLNNLAVISSNVMKPIIINGKPLKSINQFYNKKRGLLTSKLILRNGKYTSDRIYNLTLKRDNKINDYLHKASRYVVNQLVSNDIKHLVIGYNEGWKQDIALGRNTNQKFVQIPFLKFINQLEYKCKLEGIEVILQEESYTSKVSFFDNEDICKRNKYSGKRIKRGLFETNKGLLVNADLNASLNILKKYLIKNEAWNEDLFSDCVEVSSGPYLQRISL